MATIKIQGFLASLVLDGNAIISEVQSTPLVRTRSTQNKSTMDGTPDPASIPGKDSGTLQISGFLTNPEHNAMEITYAKRVPVTFLLTVEAGAAVTDTAWSGFVTLTSFEVNPDGEGAWMFNLSGDISGPVTYIPSAEV